MQELWNQITIEVFKSTHKSMFIPKIDLDYPYAQL